MKIRIKKLAPEAQIPEYKTAGAAAFDLATIESKTLQPGEIHLFKTGLVFCVPEGHVLFIFDRSSNPRKKGIGEPHGVGIIDSDYCGDADELLIQMQNIIDKPVTIEAGSSIAQGMILPVPRVSFEEVDSTGADDRGGFGSTGK